MRRTGRCLLLLAAGLGAAAIGYGQTEVTMTGAGYSAPAAAVAPGQVMTIFLTGTTTVVPLNADGERVQAATSIPLPITLAGFSATITQSPEVGVSPEIYSKQLPLFSVAQSGICSDPSSVTPACLRTELTVQIPSDLRIPPPDAGIVTTSIVISDGGGTSQAFSVGPESQNIHIVTGCDTTRQPPATCYPAITHADGTPVSAGPLERASESPAQVGETLVMYALGLGPTTPTVPEGQASPSPAPTAVLPFAVSFNYASPNTVASLSSPGPFPPSSSSSPTFVGLTPGEVGLYQINFVVPPPLPGTPSCAEGGYPNLAIFVAAPEQVLPGVFLTPSDSAEICVNTASGGTE